MGVDNVVLQSVLTIVFSGFDCWVLYRITNSVTYQSITKKEGVYVRS